MKSRRLSDFGASFTPEQKQQRAKTLAYDIAALLSAARMYRDASRPELARDAWATANRLIAKLGAK